MTPLHRGLKAPLELRKALGKPLLKGRVEAPRIEPVATHCNTERIGDLAFEQGVGCLPGLSDRRVR